MTVQHRLKSDLSHPLHWGLIRYKFTSARCKHSHETQGRRQVVWGTTCLITQNARLKSSTVSGLGSEIKKKIIVLNIRLEKSI